MSHFDRLDKSYRKEELTFLLIFFEKTLAYLIPSESGEPKSPVARIKSSPGETSSPLSDKTNELLDKFNSDSFTLSPPKNVVDLYFTNGCVFLMGELYIETNLSPPSTVVFGRANDDPLPNALPVPAPLLRGL
jgi:hypothetical protein